MSVKLETRQLGKKYGEFTALDPTNLIVKEGEFLTLLGPSGSGKSTLLQMISGLTKPSCGQIFIDGANTTNMTPAERGIGLVFQNYALFPHMTVADNVAYPLRMRRVRSNKIQPQVMEALAMVQMENFSQRYPSELSGGQQQRVALARCFVYKPSVILLDEPLGALDKKLREHMQLEIRELHQQSGATFIYVTHDQEEALAMSDRICLMNQARVEQIGTPQELYDNPISLFVADFIGHSNLFDGHVTSKGFEWGAGSIPVTNGAMGYTGSSTLLVRPESIQLVSQDMGYLKGRVVEHIFMGSDVRLLIEEEISSKRLMVRTSRSLVPNLNSNVGLRWEPEQSVLLVK